MTLFTELISAVAVGALASFVFFIYRRLQMEQESIKKLMNEISLTQDELGKKIFDKDAQIKMLAYSLRRRVAEHMEGEVENQMKKQVVMAGKIVRVLPSKKIMGEDIRFYYLADRSGYQVLLLSDHEFSLGELIKVKGILTNYHGEPELIALEWKAIKHEPDANIEKQHTKEAIEKTSGLVENSARSKAEKMLKQAELLYADGKYDEAREFAKQAMEILKA